MWLRKDKWFKVCLCLTVSVNVNVKKIKGDNVGVNKGGTKINEGGKKRQKSVEIRVERGRDTENEKKESRRRWEPEGEEKEEEWLTAWPKCWKRGRGSFSGGKKNPPHCEKL